MTNTLSTFEAAIAGGLLVFFLLRLVDHILK